MIRIIIFCLLLPCVVFGQYWKRHNGPLSPTFQVFSLNEGGGSSSSDTIRYVVLAGQSNAVGRDSVKNLPAAYQYLRDTVPGAKLGRANSGPLIIQPLWGENPVFNQAGGAELLLGDTMKTVVTTDSYVLKYAIGNTYLAEKIGSNDWNVNSGEFFQAVVNFIKAMERDDTAIGQPIKLSAFIWHQGENDGTDATDAANYQQNLEDLIDSLRSQTGYPNLPIIIGETTDQTYVADVDAGKRNIAVRELDTSNNFTTTAGTRTNTWYYETSDYFKYDGTHYNMEWQLEHSRDIFRCLMDAGVFPK
jgi:hypothetical protein